MTSLAAPLPPKTATPKLGQSVANPKRTRLHGTHSDDLTENAAADLTRPRVIDLREA